MALGKGLDSLIPPRETSVDVMQQAVASQFQHARDSIIDVAVNNIQVNPHQPRRHFSHQELEELISSIREHGVLQPLLVSELPEGGYELIAGERRLRAARIVGLTHVPTIVRNVTDLEKLELALIENIQRSDLNPIEKSEGYLKLVNEFGLNHEEAAKKIGLSRSTFSNALRMLELPGEIQKALADRTITEGHAKILLGLSTKSDQLRHLQHIIDDGLSVARFQELVRGQTKQNRRTTRSHNGSNTDNNQMGLLNPMAKAFADELSRALTASVDIQPNKNEGGTIAITYYSSDELAEIVQRIIQQVNEHQTQHNLDALNNPATQQFFSDLDSTDF